MRQSSHPAEIRNDDRRTLAPPEAHARRPDGATARTSWSRRVGALLAAALLAVGMSVSIAGSASAATEVMLGTSKPKGIKLVRNTRAVELGTSFKQKADGYVTGVRFYKLKGMTGSHTGTLWTSSGKKLGQVKFIKETSSGWQTAKLTKPVKVSAGASYVVSYHVPKGGRFGRSTSFPGVSTSVASVGKSSAARYTYKSSVTFPRSTKKSSQYWVDVTFTRSTKPTTPSVTPAPSVSPSVTPAPSVSPSVTPTSSPSSEVGNGRTAFDLDYPNRTALLADGWDFLARTASGAVRNTEQASGVSFTGPGLQIPASDGDLWERLNNTRNSLFRDLPSGWATAEVDLSFAARSDYQQAGIAVYGDDDNYVQVIRNYNSGSGGQAVAFIDESSGRATEAWVRTSATDLRLRLTRSGSTIKGSFSIDGGASWVDAGSTTRSVGSPRLGLIAGANESGATAPVATLREVLVSTTPVPAPVPSVSATPTPSATPTASARPSPSPTPTPTAPVVSGKFPTRDSVGLPAGWKPVREVTGDLHIRTAGQVVEDVRVTDGVIYVHADNVVLRRIDGVGALVVTDVAQQDGGRCAQGLLIETSEFVKNGRTSDSDPPVIGQGGYTVRNTVIDGVPEGLRVGASDIGCGPVTVENTYIRVVSPDSCTDWHGDGIQGYGGDKLTVRWTTIIMTTLNNCWGTAPFFYPDQGNTSVDINGLLVAGGGYPFRNNMPGPIRNLKVVEGSWVFGPVEGNCKVADVWDAAVVRLDSSGQPTTVRSISC